MCVWGHFFRELAMCLAQGPSQVTHTLRAPRVPAWFFALAGLELVPVPVTHAH